MSTARSCHCAAMAVLLLLVGAPASAQEFIDDFNDNHIDPDVWSLTNYGSGTQLSEQNQRLEFHFPSNASGTEFGARLISRFELRGDFDIQVDFQLLDWPDYNGVRLAIGLTDSYFDDYGMERSSLSASEPLGAHEVYVADFGPFVLVPTSDFSGSLRLVRSGSTQTGYYASAGGWTSVLTDYAPSEDMAIQLHAWSHDYAFSNWTVRAALDDFIVVSGTLIWPTTAAQTSSWSQIKSLYP